MDSALPTFHRTELDGIPTWYAESPLPFVAGLVFRVGKVDERMPSGGITHLVEHLALSSERLGAMPLQYNATVDATTTTFWASGRREDALALLSRVAAALSEPPIDQLERERRILQTEATSASGGVVPLAASLRYGATGYGLIAFDELGLSRIGSDEIVAWTRERFTAGNAAVYMTSPPPEGFSLSLPPGAPTPLPKPKAIAYLETPAVFAHGLSGTVVVSIEGKRSSALVAALAAADKRIRDLLRYRSGTTYDVQYWYEPLTLELAHVALWADSLADNLDATRNGILAVLDDLADHGPTQSELEQDLADVRMSMCDPQSVAGGLSYHAVQELFGEAPSSPAELLEERRAVTPAAAAEALRPALESLILMIPEGAAAPAGRFKAYPVDSPQRVAGRRHRRSGLPFRRSGNERELHVADEGITLVGEDYVRTVLYRDCVACAHWSQNGRTLWGSDGFRVVVDPAIWRDGIETVARIDAAIPADVMIPLELEAPVFSDPDLLAGSEALERGEHEQAAALFEAGLARCPDEGLAWIGLAACRIELRHWGAALVALERAVALRPEEEWAYRMQAFVFSRVGRIDDAVEATRRSLDLDPAELSAITNGAWLLAAGGHEREARRAADRAVELFPDAAEAWFARGWVAQEYGLRAEAEPALRRAVELEPDVSMWHNNLGWVLLQSDRTRDALECFARALELDPTNTHAIHNQALALRLLDRAGEAERLQTQAWEDDLRRAEMLVAQQPLDVEARLTLARTLSYLDRDSEALAAASAAVDVGPDDPRPLVLVAEIEAELGHRDESLETSRRAAELDPHGMDTLHHRAWTGALQDSPADAELAARNAIGQNASDTRAIEAAGYAAVAGGRWQEAEEWFERSLARNPLSCCIRAWLGVTLVNTGRPEAARHHLDAAQRIAAARCLAVERLRADLKLE